MWFDGENDSLIAGSIQINILVNQMPISIQKYKNNIVFRLIH